MKEMYYSRHLKRFSSVNHQAIEMMQSKKCHSEENSSTKVSLILIAFDDQVG
jgi:hypothetical protein